MNKFHDTYTGYTKHGHAIDGVPQQEGKKPSRVARCGGPGMCGPCSRDRTQQQEVYRQTNCGTSDVEVKDNPEQQMPGVSFHCPNCGVEMSCIPLITGIKVVMINGNTELHISFDKFEMQHNGCTATRIILNRN